MSNETLEEAAEKYADFSNDYVPAAFGGKFNETTKRDFIAGAKWQAERMYSEEEVYKLLLKHQSDYRSAVRMSNPLNWSFDIKQWFEQFKKK